MTYRALVTIDSRLTATHDSDRPVARIAEPTGLTRKSAYNALRRAGRR
jgi:hypothetical protein